MTRHEDNLKQIEAIHQAALTYKTSMDATLANWKELEKLNTLRTQTGQEILEAAQSTAMAGLDQTQAIADTAEANLSRASTIMIGGLGLGVLIGILTAILLTRAITVPVYKGV
ncbi:MAG: chemotaxis protein, partial [Deltaproteobacteria bacterium]|nr:chemotaxis protein [Deltaproteobacteria bacterium]